MRLQLLIYLLEKIAFVEIYRTNRDNERKMTTKQLRQKELDWKIDILYLL